jgi:hypothetical protein
MKSASARTIDSPATQRCEMLSDFYCTDDASAWPRARGIMLGHAALIWRRRNGFGPKFVLVGRKTMYREAALEAFTRDYLVEQQQRAAHRPPQAPPKERPCEVNNGATSGCGGS